MPPTQKSGGILCFKWKEGGSVTAQTKQLGPISVDCPKCKAPRGNRCVGPSGKTSGGYHQVRQVEANLKKPTASPRVAPVGKFRAKELRPGQVVPVIEEDALVEQVSNTEPSIAVELRLDAEAANRAEDLEIQRHAERIRFTRGALNIVIRLLGFQGAMDRIAEVLVENNVDQDILGNTYQAS